MALTPSSKSNGQTHKTPQSSARHRLFSASKSPHPSPSPVIRDVPAGEHPVEVIGRVRDHPDKKKSPASILANLDGRTVRVRADFGYRDFTLDGVSMSEEEDIDGFYKKFVESRINEVKHGEKCTVMMYGPTGSGKSHTMFGSPKHPGIVYRALTGILGNGEEEDDDGNKEKHGVGVGTFVQVSVLEIFNEEIYDLISSGSGVSKVKLEVMGKKAKNASYICGTEAGKILKEIQKVEKRRTVKSTLCNERSSRSHCMIILDVPTVGGRLMLVDMAGSENIEQAGQAGFDAKMQTAKINQGNTALRRVVESIANGDSHVPFRDSKLTMLLQDSFEDDKSKILMILCASPDPKDVHKTISTLEYGAKAKCIVRGPHTPVKDKFGGEESSSAAEMSGSSFAAMHQFIIKLQMENKQREKESNEAKMQLMKKEQEVAALRAKLQLVEGKPSEEEIDMKVNERTEGLKKELDWKLEECNRMANELEMLKRRLEDVESQLGSSSDEEGMGFAKRLMGVYSEEVPGMVKSMDLAMSGIDPLPRLSTVFEEEEQEEEDNNEEVEKQVIEEKRVISSTPLELINEADVASSRRKRIQNIFTLCGNKRELTGASPIMAASENVPPPRKECSSPVLMKDLNTDVKVSGILKENNDPLRTHFLAQNR